MRLPDAYQTKRPLHFRKDGAFRILMMSDVHHSPGEDDITMRAMGALIDRTKPDFVLLCGDQITGKTDADSFQRLLSQVVSPMEERKIPWAHVFGNHDEPEGIRKELQQAYYEAYPYCVSKAGPEDIPGTGNYFLPVLNDRDEPVFGIWGLDSQQDLNCQSEPLGYPGDLYWDLLMPNRLVYSTDADFIRFEQVMWYFNTSKALEALNGQRIPSLMFFHTPLKEFNAILYNAGRTAMRGECNEHVSCSEVNSGLFAAALQRGDVTGMFAGHDHVNTFDGVYCGIRMGFDGSIGHHTYGARANDPGQDRDRLRGGRIFDLSLSDLWHPKTEMVFLKE